MTKRRVSRVDVVAVTSLQTNAIADEGNLAPHERGALVRCCNCRRMAPVASAVDPRTTRRPPSGSPWLCRPCIREVGRKPKASGAAMPAMRG